MIELGVLVFAVMGVNEAAKRRGLSGAPFAVASVVGWVVGKFAPFVLFAWPSPFAGFVFGWAAVGLVFLSTFVIGGGGRSRPSTWRCPDCLAFNPPSTLVCLCGHDPDQSQAT